MIKVEIPGRQALELKYLVLDYNGTLATDGLILQGVAERLVHLSTKTKIYILTADTFGTVRKMCEGLPVEIVVLQKADDGSSEKLEFVRQLGSEHTVAIGNGFNDHKMLQEAALGILIIGQEGCAVNALLASDIVVNKIEDALDLLLNTKRLIATLRR